ncbi:invasion associated locus B family protein [Sphingobium sp. B12D2B]|uniref:invasion associated locus B family protein n=1 Tax=Sphingobium sp. B12D2B TaxID=2940577 RepID=UPI00222487E1|nr:invasion associated locus B family protein [Sphingobium sp. B12D2B]MCW2351807.1 invasion protein IalB [Sphingobium sp. B12D2B]
MSKLFPISFLLASAFVAGAAASAATPSAVAANAPAGVDRTTQGDWVVQCVNREGVPPCEMLQGAARKDTQEQIMRVSLAYGGAVDRYAIQIRVPLGVRLNEGPIVRIDDKENLNGYAFTRCDAEGCYVERLLTGAEIERFRAAKSAVVAVVSEEGKPLVLPMSFNGFGNAIGSVVQRNTQWAKANPKTIAAQ